MVLCVLRHLLKRNRICTVGLNTCLKRFYSVSTPQVINVDDDVRIPKMPSGMVSSNPMDHEDYFNVAELVKMKELFDARVHLGHHEGCWDENTRPYIYGARGKQHVINLNETVKCLKIALNVLSHVVYQNGVVCFIATNPRHDYLIQKTARECGEYYITRAWQMGMFNHIQNRLQTNRHPDLIIAFNLSRFERSRDAVVEATMNNIPIIGIIDTDCDPRMITYPVPGNDDTIDSVAKLCHIFQQTILNAKKKKSEDNT